MADNAFNDSGRVEFISAKKAKSIIKVIGVGGGGGNAVNHMYREGIHDVTFLVCNTKVSVTKHFFLFNLITFITCKLAQEFVQIFFFNILSSNSKVMRI